MSKEKRERDPLAVYLDLREQSAQGETVDEASLATARGRLQKRMEEVLGPRLSVQPAALTSLQSGGVTLQDATRDKKVEFAFDTQDKQGMEAAELLSALVEIEQEDPDFARNIVSAIAQSKIAAVLSTVATDTTARKPVAEEREDSARREDVSKRALALAHDNTGLVAYLGSREVTDGDAAFALMTIAEHDETQAKQVIKELPAQRVTAMTVGLMSQDRTGVLALLTSGRAAELVRQQWRNDQQPREGYTDRNNMTAAQLLWTMIEERMDDGKEPLAIIARLGGNPQTIGALVEGIIRYRYEGGSTGDAEVAEASQAQLRTYWLDVKDHLPDYLDRLEKARAKAAKQRAASPQPVEARPEVPVVDLDQDVDLDAI